MRNRKLAAIWTIILTVSLFFSPALQGYADVPGNGSVELNIEDGNIIIKDGKYNQGSGGIDHSGNSYIIKQTSDSATDRTITVENGADVYVELNNVNIGSNVCAFGIDAGAKVTLLLTGENKLVSGTEQAGLKVGAGAELLIFAESSGSIDVKGGQYSAGIGGNDGTDAGTITIHGGSIVAKGGVGSAQRGAGAGIGGGRGGGGGKITIRGGEITSSGGSRAAGIGGGQGGSSGEILIAGGTIDAFGSTLYGAGIGGGYEGPIDSITIQGGTICAEGGDGAAGIGSGNYLLNAPQSEDGGTIHISGGQITANCNSQGAGIGGGVLSYMNYKMPIEVNISGGTIIASSNSGPGIGSNDGVINISGGDITATSKGHSAGIGGNYRRPGGTINITGGAVVAESGLEKNKTSGAAIGGGCFDQDYANEYGPTINISGGDITATCYYYGAGIGGGFNQGAGDISITGGTITATGHAHGAGIGGSFGQDGTISISRAVVVASSDSYYYKDIDAGAGGSITIGGTAGNYDPAGNAARLTLQGNGISTDSGTVSLGTCLIDGAGAGDVAGTYIEGVKQTAWDQQISAVDHTFGGGSGTSADPYRISDPLHLAQLAYNVNKGYDYREQYFLLVEDLDLSALQWTPIGHDPSHTKGFDGIFDGNGKQISGMLIGTAGDPVAKGQLSQAGLFGNLKEKARIEDLTVQGEIYANDVEYVGMLAGYSESSVTPWTFANCSAEGTIVSTGSGNLRIGGLVGYSTQSNYEDCYSAVDITAYEPLAVGGIGGHIGPGASARLSVVERSTFAGTIEVTGNLIKSGSRAAGGIGGIAGNSVYNAIVNCANEGRVSGAFGSFGGIAGKHHYGAILNSYSIGSMASSDKTANTFVGGIVGLAIEVGVQNVYHAGKIETGGDIGSAQVGTIAGRSEQSHSVPPVSGVASVVSIETTSPYLYHVPTMTNGYKQYLFDLTADEMKGGWVNPIENPFFEYPWGELIHGDYALLVLLNKWLGLNAPEYPEFNFGRWAVSDDKNQGYPYLLPSGAAPFSASLNDLSVAGHGLNQAFSGGIYSYSVDVPDSLTVVEIEATVENAKARVAMNGAPGATQQISLPDQGDHTVDILVTAQDGTRQTYTLTVRIGAQSEPAPSRPSGSGPSITTHEEEERIINSTVLPVQESEEKGSAAVPGTVVSALLRRAAVTGGAGESGCLRIELPTGDEVKELEISVGADAWNRIASSSIGSLAFDTGLGTIVLDHRALAVVGEAGSDGTVVTNIRLVPGTGRPAYEVTVRNGETPISDLQDGRALVSVPYRLQPGENPQALIFREAKEDGSFQILRGFYDEASERMMLLTREIGSFTIGHNPIGFQDVPQDSPYRPAVDFLAARRITNGTSAQLFSPEGRLTRGQTVVLLMNAYGIPVEEGSADNFSDAGDAYYTDYLATARRMRLVNGVGDNLFAPELVVSRQEMLVMIYNALSVLGEIPRTRPGQVEGDTAHVELDTWAQDAASTLLSGGVVQQTDLLRPREAMLRYEAAEMLYMLLTR